MNRTTNLSVKLLLNQTKLMFHRRHYTRANCKQCRQAAMFLRSCSRSGPSLSKAHLILMRAQCSLAAWERFQLCLSFFTLNLLWRVVSSCPGSMLRSLYNQTQCCLYIRYACSSNYLYLVRMLERAKCWDYYGLKLIWKDVTVVTLRWPSIGKSAQKGRKTTKF